MPNSVNCVDILSARNALNRKFTDCVIKCGDTQWSCHKAVLCSRSTYFTAALAGNFQVSELISGHVR